jgi:uncharacterized protein
MHASRLDPRRPLVFDTRTLGPGTARSQTRTVPAPADLGAGLIAVPEGADLQLDLLLEGVAEGVLVTGSVTAPLAGECARCLEDFTSGMTVRFQELFARDPETAGADGYLLDGDLLDLEPALRDALVLELPLSPLCAEDCAGLCPDCGVRLADAGRGHGHASDDDGAWAALRGFVPAGEAAGAGDEAMPGGRAVPGTAKEH